MEIWQKVLLILYSLFAWIIAIKGFYEASQRGNAFRVTHYLAWLGIFVWGDAIVVGIFWTFAVVVSLLLDNIYFFLFIYSLFWSVRGIGEMVYWLNQQFSPLRRNPPEKLTGYHLFRNESLWFMYQLYWQCIVVAAIAGALFSGTMWVKSLFP